MKDLLLPQTPNTETVLWGVKKGKPDYAEEVLYSCKGYTNLDELKARGLAWAERNGYDRLRVSVLDMTKPPEFNKSVTI
jgi:hypothetical protein